MSNCQDCGKEVLLGISELGVKIPLDRLAPCYVVVEDVDLIDGCVRIERALPPRRAMVSHGPVCPKIKAIA